MALEEIKRGNPERAEFKRDVLKFGCLVVEFKFKPME